ncbi:MAG: diguanylate cyclase (GGDEF)-like protein [Gammaproteobacteria bacterium]
MLESTQYASGEYALCYLDLDQSKVINDTCGHITGDDLLRQIERCLLAALRERDTLGRLGGDQFDLLVEYCTAAQARHLADKLREVDAQFQFG